MGLTISSYFGKTNLRSKPIITESGPVVGKRYDIGDGRYVDAFLGIPFAKPPVGDLRFKKPELPDSWSNERLCLEHSPRAIQQGIIFEKLGPHISSSEDCLCLNVFAPDWDVPEDQPNGRAVMMFIHGGGFCTHSSANYGDANICTYLCTEEVVVVTIQYRLGILGFAATGDEHSVPNLGLWDQTFALQWIKRNIKHFKGDPENITVFGQSAGGASADMLCLSPHSNGLFSKAILMAGTASCQWAVRPVEAVRASTMKHAEKIGWKKPSGVSDQEVNAKLMEFLKKQPAKKLAIRIDGEVTDKDPCMMNFVPVFDGDFFPKPISELRKEAPKKLCITGTCEYEGLLFAGLAKKDFGLKRRSKMLQFFLPDWKYNNVENLIESATALYYSNLQEKVAVERSYIKLLSDQFINNGVQDFAHEMTLSGHTVYLYSFVHHNPKSLGILRYFMPFQAATHATELPYLFGKSPQSDFNMTAADAQIRDAFIVFFTNFAKFGDPNGNKNKKVWEPLDADNTFKYLKIKLGGIKMEEDYEGRRAIFWRNAKLELKETSGSLADNF